MRSYTSIELKWDGLVDTVIAFAPQLAINYQQMPKLTQWQMLAIYQMRNESLPVLCKLRLTHKILFSPS